MKYHPDVLAAHTEFGGDLQAMQALYDRPDHTARIATLEAQLAELAAENERLKQEAAEWEVIARAKSEEALTHRREAEAMMSALARTGEVKALPRPDIISMSGGAICLEYGDYDLRDAAYDWLEAHWAGDELEDHPRATTSVDAHKTANVSNKPEIGQCGNCGTPDWEKGDMPTCDDSYCTFPYWEATKPEGQQEPVAWEGYWPGAGSINSVTKYTRNTLVAIRWEDDGANVTPLYARPSEQAVTEAMVEAACRAHWPGDWPGDRPGNILAARRHDMRAALKAAMEAGR